MKRSGWIVVLASLLTVTALAGSKDTAKAAKMSSEDCLGCHSDPSLTIEENGKTVSLGVDDAKFKASIHSMFTCTDCHTDVTAAPHDPKPAKPQCATCHAEQQNKYEHGIHAKAAAAGNANVAKCQDCHGNVHEILPASDPKSKVAHTNIPATCGACHGKELVMAGSGVTSAPFNSYEQSVHGKAVTGGSEKAAVCTDCHGAHDICPEPTRSRPLRSSTFRTLAVSVTRRLRVCTSRASTARRWRVGTGNRRPARTATGSIRSRRRAMQGQRSPQRMSAIPARRATPR